VRSARRDEHARQAWAIIRFNPNPRGTLQGNYSVRRIVWSFDEAQADVDRLNAEVRPDRPFVYWCDSTWAADHAEM
jgi:hypothetical protein